MVTPWLGNPIRLHVLCSIYIMGPLVDNLSKDIGGRSLLNLRFIISLFDTKESTEA